jgi:hypothetical protein
VKYPELRDVKIDSEPLNDIYAQAGGGVITFNSTFLADRAAFEKSMANDEASHFHPRTVSCTPMEFVTYHEAAHILDANRGDAPSRALIDLTWTDAVDYDELARYSFKDGHFNAPEALAEAFAAVHCNGGNTSERNIAALLD